MTDAWLNDMIPDRFTVLGRRLQPLSIGHVCALLVFTPELLAEDPTPDEIAAQLPVAVDICSTPWDASVNRMASRWRSLRWRLWSWMLGKWDPVTAWRVWNEYLGEHLRAPETVWSDDAETFGDGPHWLQVLRVYAISELGMSESDAMSAPICRLQWDKATAQWMRGGVYFVESIRERQAESERIAAEREAAAMRN